MGVLTSKPRGSRKSNTRKPLNNNRSPRRDIVSTQNIRSNIPPRKSKLHLLKLPQEVRDEIFSYLLLNPILGMGTSITITADIPKNGGRKTHSPKYDLYPVVLRVCKQMYQEGFHMLYERNVFIMDCTNWMYRDDSQESQDGWYSYASSWKKEYFPITSALNVCPLTRYCEHLNVNPNDPDWVYQGNQFYQEQPTLNRLVGLQVRYVKKWKVIVRGDSGIYKWRFAESALAQFCHAICQRPGLSLSFVVCIDKTAERIKHAFRVDFGKHLDFEEIFSPLKILRKVENVEFKEAHADREQDQWGEEISQELPVYFDEVYRFAPDSAITLTSGKLKEEYTSLIKGSSSLVDPINLMCDDLVAYAQTFERVLSFRKDMDVGTDYEVLFKEDVDNPYKRPYHPTESLLRQARAAALVNDMSTFKTHRREVLKHIEKQYQNINEYLFTKLPDFIQKDKIFQGILCLGSFNNGVYTLNTGTWNLDLDARAKQSFRESVTEALIILEDCVASFTRKTTELPYKLRVGYRLRDPTKIYQDLPREQLMRKIQDAYIRWDYTSFLQCFKEVVNDMYAQHSEIREARKMLFRWDSGRTVRGFGVNDGDFEAIVWDELEPSEEFFLELWDLADNDEDFYKKRTAGKRRGFRRR